MPQAPSHFKVLFAGIMSLILTLGIARFAYTPLLPIMQAQTALGDATGGWLATFNYMGYMCGALTAAMISNLRLKDTLYRIGLVLALVTTAGMAMSESMWLWGIMRFLAGLSSAAGLLIGSGLILNWLIRHNHRMELGIHFSGLGLGIVLSAVAVDLMEAHLSWDQQWLALTAIGLILFIPAWGWLPRPDANPFTTSGVKMEDRPPKRNWMILLFASYFCAGFGYVISATFLVVIVEAEPALQGYGETTWLIVGLAAAPACFIWDRIARKTGELKALALAFALQIIGIILPTFDASLSVVMFSAALYGGTFIGIVSLMLTMIGKFYPTKPAKPMGKLTLSYGVAQIAAPALAGTLAETSGTYNGSLYLAAAIMVIGLMLVLYLVSHENKMRRLVI
ncbi:MAG: YbfB/YjiJ family MFS transporter [Sedimenticola sp.]|uniref:YbfB/YjiJ family MFS transporter n=1 Tax=Sedimenticola thiotaurini TaxID=1543721 RepID=A0A558CMY0_9GAMM|nr:YbfB/YjiJ family MFS transporter [Sedimenticola sp.]MCW8947005.1 YbfB/YjiJ family MFS transporter [Sedimenticola sp.]MCW8975086.1 YbfB/YjiJ family MFS transporter [Sedimenticola sp.]TVT50130.1 MAG: YbfB/YjiJ family MFS transporter [Sedimenticola thiotaurini]